MCGCWWEKGIDHAGPVSAAVWLYGTAQGYMFAKTRDRIYEWKSQHSCLHAESRFCLGRYNEALSASGAVETQLLQQDKQDDHQWEWYRQQPWWRRAALSHLVVSSARCRIQKFWLMVFDIGLNTLNILIFLEDEEQYWVQAMNLVNRLKASGSKPILAGTSLITLKSGKKIGRFGTISGTMRNT